jgi:hypothetical protein
MENTDVKRIHFKCSNCENTGEAVEVKYKGGLNDRGGFILLCNQCGAEFFLQVVNPSDSFESRLLTHNFKLIKIIDFDWPEDLQEIKDNFKQKVARDLLSISGQEEMPILKGAWKSKPEFRINVNDRIFTCFKCGNNVEDKTYKYLEISIDKINKEYNACFNWYIKSRCDPKIITYSSSIQCEKCKTDIEYTVFAKFNGKGDQYSIKDFYLADIHNFSPVINGVYSREQSKRFLEKLVLRWNLIASRIIIVSPFIGFDKKLSIRTPFKFLNLLEWFLTLNSFDKTQVLIRRSEFTKIKEVIGIDIFNKLNGYGLLNNIIEEMNNSTPRFHAKFYAGVIPNEKESHVELLTGSYNLHEESESMENLIYNKLTLKDFEEQYLLPLKIEEAQNSYKSDFEILRIIDSKSNIIKPKFVSDIIKDNGQ